MVTKLVNLERGGVVEAPVDRDGAMAFAAWPIGL
jgi:hypothetical protein